MRNLSLPLASGFHREPGRLSRPVCRGSPPFNPICHPLRARQEGSISCLSRYSLRPHAGVCAAICGPSVRLPLRLTIPVVISPPKTDDIPKIHNRFSATFPKTVLGVIRCDPRDPPRFRSAVLAGCHHPRSSRRNQIEKTGRVREMFSKIA